MITVTLYYREKCPECDQALADLKSLQETIPHQLVTVNVDHDRVLQEKIGPNLPFVEVGPYRLKPPFKRQDLQILLSAARDRIDQMGKIDQVSYQKRLDKGHTISASDRISVFFSHHYLAVANLVLLFYIGLPFLAPVLMRAGQTLPATLIYKIYSPLCHQLAFRSWFLFGQQPYYPRQLAGIAGVIPYETLINSTQIDLIQAREFTGSPVVGYKVALCERCMAIYASMLLFGLAFWATGRRLKSLPWYFWILIGLVPIGLDGFSQLPGLATGLPAWLPLRESTPLLRTITGTLFGLTTAWYLFPMIENTAREVRLMMQRKLAVIQQSDSPAA